MPKRIRLPNVNETIYNIKRTKIIKQYKLSNIETVNDLLNVACMLYDPEIDNKILNSFTFDKFRLLKLVPELIKLNKMDGMVCENCY